MTNRYIKHELVLGNLNKKLRELKVLVIGAGGLGTNVLELLSRIGVKKIIIVDDDVISESDLNRQILYTPEDIGKLKVEVAIKKLKKINPEVIYKGYCCKFDENFEKGILEEIDVIFDCTDNFETRCTINKLSFEYRKPFIFGSVENLKGMAMLIVPGITPCLECIFPKKIEKKNFGVFNAAVSIVASIQIILLLKYLEDEIENVLYYINLRDISLEKIKVRKNPNCKICKNV